MKRSVEITLVINLSLLLAGCGVFSAPENRLVNAARKDDLASLRKILKKSNVSLDKPEEGMLGYTALIAACLTDGTNVFNFLLASKVNVNARSRDGETPLMMATMVGDVNSNKVIALINAGANVNAKSPQGESVLHYAYAAGASNIVYILKNHGAM